MVLHHIGEKKASDHSKAIFGLWLRVVPSHILDFVGPCAYLLRTNKLSALKYPRLMCSKIPRY